MTSIFEGQPPKTRPFPIKTRGPIWVLGKYTTDPWILYTFQPTRGGGRLNFFSLLESQLNPPWLSNFGFHTGPASEILAG